MARPSSSASDGARDLGLLQLFFADLEPTTVRLAVAEEQLAQHRARLAAYEAAQRPGGGIGAGARSIEQWRAVTLPMGLLYERAAIEFWAGIAAGVQCRGCDRFRPGAGRARAHDRVRVKRHRPMSPPSATWTLRPTLKPDTGAMSKG